MARVMVMVRIRFRIWDKIRDNIKLGIIIILYP